MRLRLRLLLTMFVIGLPLTWLFWWSINAIQKNMEEDNFVQLVTIYMKNGGREACEISPENWKGTQFGNFIPHNLNHLPPDMQNPSDNQFGHRDPGVPSGDFHLNDRASFDPQSKTPPFGHKHPGPPFDGPKDRPPSPPSLYAYDINFQSKNPQAPKISEDYFDDINGNVRTNTVVKNFLSMKKREKQLLIKMPWDDGPCVYILARKMVPRFFDLDRPVGPRFMFWLLPLFSAIIVLLLTIGPVVSRVRRLTKEVRESEASLYSPIITVKGNDEVGRLAEAFKEAAKKIRRYIKNQEQREQALRNFLENTMHDVMIPLTVLQGHLSRLDKKLKDENRIFIDSAIHESNYISSLINNLSTVAKLESGEPKLQSIEVNLNNVLKGIISRQRPIASQHHISLNGAMPENILMVMGDLTFIEQAINNIVYNAIRHNKEGGNVAIILEDTEHGSFNIRVIDDGPGIPEYERKRLIERFYRGNVARTRYPGGQGIGLNITYQIVKLHDWELNLAESEYGGLEVKLSGPLSNSQEIDNNNMDGLNP